MMQIDELQLKLAMSNSQLEEAKASKEKLKKALLGEQRKSEEADAQKVIADQLREEVARMSAMAAREKTRADEMTRLMDGAQLQMGELASALDQERESKAALKRAAAASRVPPDVAAEIEELKDRIRRLSSDRDVYREEVRSLGVQQRRVEQALAAAEAQAAKATAALREEAMRREAAESARETATREAAKATAALREEAVRREAAERARAAAAREVAKATAALRAEAVRREAAESAREAATREAARERALKATADAALAKAAEEMRVATEAARQLEEAAEAEAAGLREVALAAEADAKEAREKLTKAREKIRAQVDAEPSANGDVAATVAVAASPSPAKRDRSILAIATLVVLCGGALWWAQNSGAEVKEESFTPGMHAFLPPTAFGDGNDSSGVDWAEADASPPPPLLLTSPRYETKVEVYPSQKAGSSWWMWTLSTTMLSLGVTAAYVYLRDETKADKMILVGGDDAKPEQHTEDVPMQQASPTSSRNSQEDWAVINGVPAPA